MEYLVALGQDVEIVVRPTRECGGTSGGASRLELGIASPEFL
jgi:hypothetical protein